MVTVKLKSGYCSGPVIDFYLIKASLKQDTLHLQRELEANTFLFSLTHTHTHTQRLASASETEGVSATPPGARLEQCFRNVRSHSSALKSLNFVFFEHKDITDDSMSDGDAL